MSAITRAVVRLYRALAALLPPEARADRDDMVAAFAELLEAMPAHRRAGRAAVGVLALLGVMATEWLEWIGAAPPSRPNGRRGGMGLVRILRYALRTLTRTPTFTVSSVALMAIGVGAVTTIFTLVDHVLLRPLPYPDADRLISLENGSFQGPFFRELETLSTVAEWAGASAQEANLVGEGDPIRIQQVRVTERFFGLFGARARLGRLLRAEDFRAADVVVLEENAWRRIWGADPSVVGRTIRVDGELLTVVGVTDASFVAPEAMTRFGDVDVYRPVDWSSELMQGHTHSILQIAGRLAPGVDRQAAQTEVDALGVRMADVHENYRRRDGSPREVPVLSLSEMTVQRVRTGLGLLMGAVSLLLLVACANVANLFLARGLGRTREMAVRRALGAGSGSIAAQLLAESLVVGLVGGALGTAMAWLGIRAFLGLNPSTLPRQQAVTIDPRVLAFVVGISVLTSIVFGLLPALRSVRRELSDELRGSGRSATSGRGVALLRAGLVGGEVALSLVLVSAAGLLLRSFLSVRAQEPGFAVEDVWTLPLNLPRPDAPADYLETMDGVLRQIGEVPGVRNAAYGLTAPLQWTGGGTCCWGSRPKVPGREDDQALNSMVQAVTEDYFATLDIGLTAGRSWTTAEAIANPMPVVISAGLARELAGSVESALGTHVEIGSIGASIVVGVADDIRFYGLDQRVHFEIYLPMARIPFAVPEGTIVVRADPSVTASLPHALREAVWAAEPGLPVPEIVSMREALDASTGGRRFDSAIFAAFAGLALLLAAGGVYGTLLYVAGERKKELGIRLALGASRGRIEAHVLRSGATIATLGIAVGFAGAWLANSLLESRIWGVERDDPVALGGAALLLFVTVLVASWLPARRAGGVNPLETLRVE